MNEITTRIEQPPPLDVATVDAVTRLLAQMERTALAQRPVVIHEPQQPATAPQTVPAAQVPPTHIYVPMPPAAAFTTFAAPRERSIWPLVFTVSMAGVLGSSAAAAATGSSIAVLAVFGFASAWCAASYQLVLNRKA